MNLRNSVKRIIALEIRASKIGFAAFEGPSRLLDWGLRSVGSSALTHVVAERIRTLFEFYRPSIVVVRERNPKGKREQRTLKRIREIISRETRNHSARFTAISSQEFRAYFDLRAVNTKYAIASEMAKRFDELSWKLPRQRKAYESESPSLAVFDAVATGIVFLERK